MAVARAIIRPMQSAWSVRSRRFITSGGSEDKKEKYRDFRDFLPQARQETPAGRAKTPVGKLDEIETGVHPHAEKNPLRPWPDGVNPHTGEVGGPKGPEPTRYGDWERKGRVSDF
uniref:Succinate dehydrogenase assembly factor 4, mitochondrial n=1 Tax=Strigamia maritima TaxID=126957 RepID=T1JFR3_STRMM